MLTRRDGNEGFVIYSDAFKLRLGCVLIQYGNVVGYASKQLKVYEQNYATHDLELAATVFVLKLWRHYLHESKFEVYTDHKNLKYIFTQSDLYLRQRRWMEYLKDFDFQLLYYSGKTNVVVVVLSRKDRQSHQQVSRF